MNKYKAFSIVFCTGLGILAWYGSKPLWSYTELRGIRQTQENHVGVPDVSTEEAALSGAGIQISTLFSRQAVPSNSNGGKIAVPQTQNDTDGPIPARGIKYVGMVTEVDIPHYFFRDTNMGKLYKLNTKYTVDGVVLEVFDKQNFIVTIKGKKYYVSKN
jgi:hypothetical protein